MATERFTIVVDQRGVPQVKRSIDAIGESANRATRGIFLLQRAFFVLGAGGLVRGLARQLDVLTNFENRLRLTSASAAEAEAVQQKLFDVARRSRTEFESVAEIYSRTALSVQNLGISQAETLRFTESLSKATILSGASAREANAALVQLAQGLASNRLSGDELRSVLEQLPFVADVISRSLGVTRGELRKMGADGKISAEVVLKAFRDTREEIDEKFANTVATLGQAFSVAKTNFQQLLDSFDDGTGVSKVLAKAIIAISENLKLILGTVLAVGAAFTLNLGARAVGGIAKLISQTIGLVNATRTANAAEATRAATIGKTINAQLMATRADTARATVQQGLAGKLLQSAAAEARSSAFTVQGNAARNIQTGQFVSLSAATDRQTAAQLRLNIAQSQYNASTAALNGLTARQATLSARSATALDAQTAALARNQAGLARFGVLGRAAQFAVRGISLALGGVVALLGGPISAGIIAVAALGAAFVSFGNNITVATSQGDIGLRDLAQGAFQVLKEKIGEVGSFFSKIFGGFPDILRSVFNAFQPILNAFSINFEGAFSSATEIASFILYGWIDSVVGIFRGLFAVFALIPSNFENVWKDAATLGLKAIAFFVNKAVSALNKVLGLVNAIAEFAGIEGRLDLFEGFDTSGLEFSSFGKDAGEAFTEAFNGSTGVSDFVKGLGSDVTDAARRIRDARDEDAAFSNNVASPVTPTKTDTKSGGGKGGGGSKKTFDEEIRRLREQIEVEKQFGLEKEKGNKILEIEKRLKRELSGIERDQVATAVELLEVAKIQGATLEAINAPQEKFKLTQMALNDLFAQGAINLGQYNDKLRETYIAAQQAQGTLAGGFRSAIAQSVQSASEFGSAIGGAVTGAIDGLSDSIVDLAKTGKANFRELFQSLFANLLKLAANRLFTQLIGGILGVPGGGLAGALGGGGGLGLLGFSQGGSIAPSGTGSTDSQVVAFRKRPDERVDVLTPRQQRQQAEAQGGGASIMPIPAPNVNVAVVLSESDIENALSGTTGDRVVVRALERNSKSAKQVLSG